MRVFRTVGRQAFDERDVILDALPLVFEVIDTMTVAKVTVEIFNEGITHTHKPNAVWSVLHVAQVTRFPTAKNRW